MAVKFDRGDDLQLSGMSGQGELIIGMEDKIYVDQSKDWDENNGIAKEYQVPLSPVIGWLGIDRTLTQDERKQVIDELKSEGAGSTTEVALLNVAHGAGMPIGFSRDSTGVYRDSEGHTQEASKNEPRYDHTDDGDYLGLLIEDTSTNAQAPASEDKADISTSDWYKTGGSTFRGAHRVSPYPQAVNMVAKSTFQDGDTGAWGNATIDTANPEDTGGFTKVLRWDDRNCYETNWFPVQEGQKFFVSANLDAYYANHDVAFGIQFQESDGHPRWVKGDTQTAGHGWSEVSGWITVPKNMIKGRPWLQIDGFDNFGYARAVSMYIGYGSGAGRHVPTILATNGIRIYQNSDGFPALDGPGQLITDAAGTLKPGDPINWRWLLDAPDVDKYTLGRDYDDSKWLNGPIQSLSYEATRITTQQAWQEIKSKTNRQFDDVQEIFKSNGADGVYYDPSDMSTLFQDAAGTVPVTASGQPVGMMRDKSGNGWDLAAPNDSSRPLLKNDEHGYFLELDGVDDSLGYKADWDLDLSNTPVIYASRLMPVEGTNTGRGFSYGGAILGFSIEIESNGSVYAGILPLNIIYYSDKLVTPESFTLYTDSNVSKIYRNSEKVKSINDGYLQSKPKDSLSIGCNSINNSAQSTGQQQPTAFKFYGGVILMGSAVLNVDASEIGNLL